MPTLSDFKVGDKVTYFPDWVGYTRPTPGVVTGFRPDTPYGPRVLVSLEGQSPDEIDPEDLSTD